jgi:hypothetical protein
MFAVLIFTQNKNLLVFRNIFTGLILDSYGYFVLEIFFIICLEIALLAAAFLYVYNSVRKGMLNDSPSVRRAKQEKVEATTNAAINIVADSPLSPNDDDGKSTYA